MPYVYLILAIVLWFLYAKLLFAYEKSANEDGNYLVFLVMIFAAHFSATFLKEKTGFSYSLGLFIFVVVPLLIIIRSIVQAHRLRPDSD